MLTHHAYFYEGDAGLLPALAELARKEAGLPKNSPDISIQSYEKFGIDESRGLRQRANLKATDGRQIFIIAAASIPTEAQQALLKLFEEPQLGTVFVLLVPHGMLLSTLRSRCLPFPKALDSSKKDDADTKKFLAASYKERTAQVGEMLKEDENVRDRARNFINGLERELYTHLQKSAGAKKNELAQGLSEISSLRGYLSDRAPSLKMIFEHLAAALPKL